MKRLLISIVSIVLLVIMPYMNVYANEAILNENNNEQVVDLTASVVSTFELKVPTSIHITELGLIPFEIKGKGELGQYEYISVEVPDNVRMVSDDDHFQFLTITKSGDRFTYEDIMDNKEATLNYTIDSSKLLTGNWTGSFTINASIQDLYFRVPASINFEFPYITVIGNSNTNCSIYNHGQPLYYYEKVEGVTSGYNSINRLTSGNSNINNYRQYVKQTDGSWKIVTLSSWSVNDYGLQIISKDQIRYTNYDIRYGNNQSEIWLESQCPDMDVIR